MQESKKTLSPKGEVFRVLEKNLSIKFCLWLLVSTMIFVKTKKGNITGKILKVQTVIAFKHEFEQSLGLNIKKMHKIISNDDMILFDLKIFVMYNNILGKGKI